jgi:glutathione S-transferase
MLQVFHAPRTRSLRVLWLAEEMGILYEVRRESLGKASADFLAANPTGAFPAIVDDEVAMGESVAIMQYLTDRYGPTPLARRPGDADYADYLQFLIYGEASMGAFLNPLIMTRFMAPEDKKDNFTADAAIKLFMGRVAAIAPRLAKADYLLGDFSAADISVGYALYLGAGLGIGPYPQPIADYWSRLQARPAYQRAAAVK